MNFIIFGDPENWSRALEVITAYCPDIQIYGLSAPHLDDSQKSDVTFSITEIKHFYQKHLIDGVIQIQGENPYYFQLLEQCGIANIYVIPDLIYQKVDLKEDISNLPVLYPYHDVLPELMQLEFHLADHCNLNCKGCSHFSNLVPNPVFPDKAQFEKDLTQLSSYFSQIHHFYLLGGEPLLNKDIGDYIQIVRKAFPYTQLNVVTNGILLLSLPNTLISIIKKSRAHISISDYSCLDRERIISFVQKNALSAELREGKECFSKYLNPKGDSEKNDVFFDCIRRNCTYLDHGKIAACCQPFTIHYFNDYFHESIPENEGINLYEDQLDGWEIQRRLITPMESCRYCSHDIPFDWAPSHKPFSKEDWCV